MKVTKISFNYFSLNVLSLNMILNCFQSSLMSQQHDKPHWASGPRVSLKIRMSRVVQNLCPRECSNSGEGKQPTGRNFSIVRRGMKSCSNWFQVKIYSPWSRPEVKTCKNCWAPNNSIVKARFPAYFSRDFLLVRHFF